MGLNKNEQDYDYDRVSNTRGSRAEAQGTRSLLLKLNHHSVTALRELISSNRSLRELGVLRRYTIVDQDYDQDQDLEYWVLSRRHGVCSQN